jgi:SAM-dependent methyltransferase
LEYSYSGTMRLIAFMKPRWFVGNDTATKWNPDVKPQNLRFGPGNGVTWKSRLLALRIFGKSPIRAYFRLNQILWDKLPRSFTASRPMCVYGALVHKLVCAKGDRAQGLGTCFLRNRPALELIRRIVDRKRHGETVRVAVLGCSTGAEVYSIAWRIRSARPDLVLHLHAMDISRDVVEFARNGVYPMKPAVKSAHLSDPAVLERMSSVEIGEFFDQEDDVLRVKPWIREGINWDVGDVGDPQILEILGTYDIVVANNFFCHMEPAQAEKCLRNIARLVNTHGYLFVSGIDLDVRTRVALESGWRPVDELLEEIHEGDVWLRHAYPGHYTGLEPLNKRRSDWTVRYAAVFELSVPGRIAKGTEINSVAQLALGAETLTLERPATRGASYD